MITPPPAPLTYSVRAWARVNGTASARIGSADIDLDTNWGHPPTGQPGPADLLACAFAACLLKNLARTRDLLGFEDRTARSVARRTQALGPLPPSRVASSLRA